VDWFWHAMWIAFAVIPVTLLWIAAVLDIFLRPYGSAWVRVGWVIVVLAIPLFGALIYVFTRPAVDRVTVPGRRSHRSSAVKGN
jgi:hypothetical protein